MNPLFLELLVKVSLWLGGAWLLHLALAQVHPRWRVLLWRLVAATAIAFPLFLVSLPRLPVSLSLPEPVAVVQDVAPAKIRPVAAPAVPAPDDMAAPNQSWAHPGSQPSLKLQRLPAATGDAVSNAPDYWTIVEWLYAVPLGVLVAGLVIAGRRMRDLVKRSAPVSSQVRRIFDEVAADLSVQKRVEVRVSAEISSPLLVGWVRPILMLPAGVHSSSDRSPLRTIFAHELAHLLGRDLPWSLLIRLVQITLWFHPLAWHISTAHGRACEEVADGASARYVGNVEEYGDTLAALALRAHAWHVEATSLPMARVDSLPHRLKNLERNSRGRRLQRRTLVIAGSVAFGLVCVWAALSVSRARMHGKPNELYGKVVDPAGHPIANAVVGISYAGPKVGESILCPTIYPDCLKQTTTNRWGEFRITDVDRGLKFIILTSAPGYDGAWKFNVAAEKSPFTFTIKPRSAQVPSGTSEVVGRVIDHSGRPVPYAQLRPASRLNEESMAVADADGRFEVRLKDESEPSVFVQAPGYAPKLVEQFRSRPGGVMVTLGPGVNVRGRLIDHGEALANVKIVLADRDLAQRPLQHDLVATTDERGRFVFSHVPALRLYSLYGSRDSLPSEASTRITLVRSVPEVADLDLGDLSTVPAVTVHGQIHLPSGDKFPKGSELILGRENTLDYQLVELKDDGAFETSAIPDERVDIAVNVPGYRLVVDEKGEEPKYYDIRDRQNRIDATLVSKETATSEDLKGVVLGPDGKPAAGVTVGLVLDGEGADIIEDDLFKDAFQRMNVGTDKSGAFHLARAEKPGTLVAVGKAGFGELRVAGGTLTIQLRAWGRVTGRFAPGGKAVGRRALTGDFTRYAQGEPKIRFSPRTVTDPDGNFTLDCVPGGIVNLQVHSDTDPVGYPNLLTTNVDVSWGKTTAVRFDAVGCIVTGRVDIPPDRARLLDFHKNDSRIRRLVESYFTPPDAANDFERELARTKYRETEAGRRAALEDFQVGVPFGPDGNFQVAGLPPGKYQFSSNLRWKSEGSILDSGAWGGKTFEILPDQKIVEIGTVPVRMGTPPLPVGEPAPKFDLVASDGSRVQSDALRGKVLVMQLARGDLPWGKSWASDAQDFFDSVRRNVRGADGIEYLLMTTAESEAVFKKLCQSIPGSWRNCYIGTNADSAMMRAFGIEGYPVEVVIAADGKLAYLGYNFGEASVVAAKEIAKGAAR